MYGLFASFLLFSMPSNFAAHLLFFARTPTCLHHELIIPVHVACWFSITLSHALSERGILPRFCSLERILSHPIPYAVLEAIGILDNVATGLVLAGEVFSIRAKEFPSSGFQPLVASFIVGVAVNLAGGTTRHFLRHGAGGEGACRFFAELGSYLTWSAALNSAYVIFALNGGHLLGVNLNSVAGAWLPAPATWFELIPYLYILRGLWLGRADTRARPKNKRA